MTLRYSQIAIRHDAHFLPRKPRDTKPAGVKEVPFQDDLASDLHPLSYFLPSQCKVTVAKNRAPKDQTRCAPFLWLPYRGLPLPQETARLSAWLEEAPCKKKAREGGAAGGVFTKATPPPCAKRQGLEKLRERERKKKKHMYIYLYIDMCCIYVYIYILTYTYMIDPFLLGTSSG